MSSIVCRINSLASSILPSASISSHKHEKPDYIAKPESSSRPHIKRGRQWLRANGKISPQGGQHAHLNALAYMTDSYFIGFVSSAHNIPRFSRPLEEVPPQTPPTSAGHHSPLSETPSKHEIPSLAASTVQYLRKLAEFEKAEIGSSPNPSKNTVGMMVSLDHTIYFHRPREFHADEWMYTEIESPWAGQGRGLVTQRIWNRHGRLVATCVQEVSFCHSLQKTP